MKILLITTDVRTKTGYGQYARNIITPALAAGHEVHALVHETAGMDGVVEYPVLDRMHAYFWRPWRVHRLGKLISEQVTTIKPDVIHVIAEGYVTGFAFSRPSVPVVLTVHGTYARLPLTVPAGLRQWCCSWLWQRTLKRLAHIVAVSETTKRSFLAYTPALDPAMVSVIHNAVTLPATYQTDRPTGDRHVITVGAVKKRKGIYEAIVALADWSARHQTKVVYDVVGMYEDGTPYVNKVQAAAAEAASDYFEVVWHGHTSNEDRDHLLGAAALYAHLESVTAEDCNVEGFGIGIIEAASYGVPALVAEGSATAEAVHNGISGCVVHLDDATAVQQALDTLLLSDQIERAATREWAAAHAPEILFTDIDTIYKNVAEPRI